MPEDIIKSFEDWYRKSWEEVALVCKHQLSTLVAAIHFNRRYAAFMALATEAERDLLLSVARKIDLLYHPIVSPKPVLVEIYA